jgi:hypothetical protein
LGQLNGAGGQFNMIHPSLMQKVMYGGMSGNGIPQSMGQLGGNGQIPGKPIQKMIKSGS